MAQVPTPAYTPPLRLCDCGPNEYCAVCSPARWHGPKASIADLGPDVTSRLIVMPKHWPDCSRCNQSSTGSYAGKPTCNRCSSNRRLNG